MVLAPLGYLLNLSNIFHRYTHVLDEAQERKAQLDKLEKSLITVHSLFKGNSIITDLSHSLEILIFTVSHWLTIVACI
jgi:t-SNARE complex subunit (syntaxin)